MLRIRSGEQRDPVSYRTRIQVTRCRPIRGVEQTGEDIDAVCPRGCGRIVRECTAESVDGTHRVSSGYDDNVAFLQDSS